MGAQHTPGPWRWSPAGVMSGAEGSSGANVVCEAPAWHLSSFDNWAHNAPLIAAAPELLSAARTARRVINVERTVLIHSYAQDHDPATITDELALKTLSDFDAALGELDAAIAEAGGAS